MYVFLMLVGALPYFFLFHIGFVSFFVFLISNLANRRFTVSLTKIKVIATLYGIAGGLLLPFMEAYFAFPDPDAPIGIVFFNLPALLSLLLLPEGSRVIAEYNWEIFAIYGAYGIIGGWGLGQLIDWFRERRKK